MAGAVAGALVSALVVLVMMPAPMTRPLPRPADDPALRVAQERLAAAEARVTALEGRADASQALEALAADLTQLRDDVRAELELVDGSLRVLSDRVDRVLESGQVVSGAAMAALEGELTEEERQVWAALSRDSADPGQRFSALVVLGRHKSDDGIQAAVERLEDTAEVAVVLWQALRNLGEFKERSAAVAVARLLEHDEAVVRAAAFKALAKMGAPDPGFDPVAKQEDRAESSARLRAWAEAND